MLSYLLDCEPKPVVSPGERSTDDEPPLIVLDTPAATSILAMASAKDDGGAACNGHDFDREFDDDLTGVEPIVSPSPWGPAEPEVWS